VNVACCKQQRRERVVPCVTFFTLLRHLFCPPPRMFVYYSLCVYKHARRLGTTSPWRRSLCRRSHAARIFSACQRRRRSTTWRSSSCTRDATACLSSMRRERLSTSSPNRPSSSQWRTTVTIVVAIVTLTTTTTNHNTHTRARRQAHGSRCACMPHANLHLSAHQQLIMLSRIRFTLRYLDAHKAELGAIGAHTVARAACGTSPVLSVKDTDSIFDALQIMATNDIMGVRCCDGVYVCRE
jgi:hypothetical protein